MIVAQTDFAVQDNVVPQWTSSMGLGSQFQSMPSLPAGYLSGKLAPSWIFQHQFMQQPKGKFIDGEVITDAEDLQLAELPSSTQNRALEAVCKLWRANQWQVQSMPLIYEGKIIFKTQGDLSAWATDSLSSQAVLRSLKMNRYFPDDVSKFILEQADQNRRNFPAASNVPFNSIETMQFFGDPLFQSMAIHNGIVFSVEGVSFGRDDTFRDKSRPNPVNVWSSPPIRSRTTFLSAYDLKTGKTLWNEAFPRADQGNDLAESAVVGPPVGYHDSILLPVLASGRFLVIALDCKTGDIKWRTAVCDIPQLQPSSTTLVQLSVVGSDVFMVCGSGILANLDAGAGQLRWIRRYKRSVEEIETGGPNQQFFGRMNQDWQRYTIKGWQHDLAAAWGPWIIVAGTDTDYLAGYRRSDGELVWQAPRAEVLGCTVDQWLGIHQGIVYAIGARGLIAYELAAEGRLYGTPQRLAKPISGRGIITSEGILLPVMDHLELYDLKSLVKLRDIPLTLPGEIPVGSLVSDGKRLWAAAMNRLIAFDKVDENSDTTTPEEATQKDEDQNNKQEPIDSVTRGE